jgi:Protein of unknown function, DUF481
MTLSRRNLKLGTATRWSFLVLLLLVNFGRAEVVTVVLRNGNRLSGEMISLSTDSATISNLASGRIVLPIAEVEKILKLNPGQSTNAPPAAAVPAAANHPAPPPPAPAAEATPANSKPNGTGQSPPKAAPAPQQNPVKPKRQKRWVLDAQLGVDLEYNQSDRQLYYTRVKWTYGKDRFRGIVDYLANYGKTDGTVSANNMNGSVRLELDVTKNKRVYAFDAAGSAYDEIRKIDLSFDDSAGLGYKLLQKKTLNLDVDLGGNFQRQYFTDQTHVDYKAVRIGESLTWRINSKWIFDEKAEYYARLTGIDDYRARAESNLRYLIMSNLTINLTAIDQYDTQPASNVTRNDLLLRATLGVKF